ncbi:hypothetical protein LOAG_08807 [Loa loa]|uniref:Uncharacterized protein n=1 Tax=Loa loa TaxID=7209 RepID=A0A1S0TSW5_LOALO|nr:hypothetical protein LOAG_08807 [Loa loa]EFO19687.2 hypothetical protein LOAG_08807 [Loa loa]
MPRRSFTLTSSLNQYPSDTESMHQPQWRIRSSVERSSSAVDIDGFVSMRRRKSDDKAFNADPKSILVPPIPYPRNCSLFSERLRRDRNSPSHSSLNFPITGKYITSKNSSDVKTTTTTCMQNISNGFIENDSVQLANGDVLAVGSKDPNNDVSAKRVCFQCCNLQKQLSDLSCRLKQATDEMNSKSVGELMRKTKEIVVIDKSVGGSCEILNDTITKWIKVEKKDTASDALLIEVDDKRTSISLADQVEMRWYKDIASSPVPEPQLHSIGVTTECHFECNTGAMVVKGELRYFQIYKFSDTTVKIQNYSRFQNQLLFYAFVLFSSDS